MRHFDVGGGLAIDYDGSATDTSFSMHYTLRGYADAVVDTVLVGRAALPCKQQGRRPCCVARLAVSSQQITLLQLGCTACALSGHS